MDLFERALPRRLFYSGLIALAALGIVIAVDNGRTSPTNLADLNPAVNALLPPDGGTVLRQSTVGITVASGYQARLIVNGVSIPEGQMSGDTGLGQYHFTPGEGTILDTLHGGQNCITATYWRAAEGPGNGETTTWCFTAT